MAALGGAEASARNCGAASWGRAKGAGLGGSKGRGDRARGGGRRLLRGNRGGTQGWDRVGEGGAGEAGQRKSEGAPERAPAAATDWTMKEAQPKLQATCRTAIVKDFDPRASRCQSIALQDRMVPKPLDDSGLAGDFTGEVGRSLGKGGVWRPPSASGRSPWAGVQFCARRSDFKGLSLFFCNSNEQRVTLKLYVVY